MIIIEKKWKDILDYFHCKGELDKESYYHLLLFFEKMECLYDNVITDEEDFVLTEVLESVFDELNQMYSKKNKFNIENEKYKELKIQLAVNEEKYIKEAYKKAKCHYILCEMFKKVGKRLEEEIRSRGRYKKYGKNNDLDLGYHCLSPCEDLIISNVSRGTLYKNIPKDMTGKSEYIYDEKGRLILYKKNNETHTNVSYLQFLLYGSETIVTLLYMVIDDKYLLHDVGIQYYEGEQIVKNDIVVWGIGNEVQNLKEFHGGSYIYEEGRLKNAWKEKFMFPNFLLTRDLYAFRYDEEGYISEFSKKEFWGDKERVFPWGEHYTLVQEKKKKDTGKDSARWKKPNYFTIK